jgi:hypothetical protein
MFHVLVWGFPIYTEPIERSNINNFQAICRGRRSSEPSSGKICGNIAKSIFAFTFYSPQHYLWNDYKLCNFAVLCMSMLI